MGRLTKAYRILLCAVLLFQQTPAPAFETDQYNLPPKPLADIGEEVSLYVEDALRIAVDKVNGEINRHQRCLTNGEGGKRERGCHSLDEEQAKLAYLRSNDAIAREIYNKLGAGFPPTTRSGTWMESHHFKGHPARYKTSYGKSIFLVWPTDYITISSTVNLYGAQFGTDKIAHFFQQGFTYYNRYNHAMAQGATPDEARWKAVRWGQFTERTIYGTLVSGVYSNGDLFANYVGMKFYQGLTQPLKIGESTRPPILVLKKGAWTINDNIDVREALLKPFISNHLNEALNPSIFTVAFGLRGYVRKVVRKRSCRLWFTQDPHLDQDVLNRTTRELTLWHGEDYGFTPSEHFVTIANTCFAVTQAGSKGTVPSELLNGEGIF